MATAPAVELPARRGRDLLARARLGVEPGLRGWVEQLPPAMAWPAGYHLGWLDADGRSVAAVRGKAVRPALAFACAEAVGGRARDAVSAAVAVELVHAFSLVHDDIIDGDRTRRHRPTVWRAFGVPAAVLTGDVLLALACQTAAGDPGPRAARSVSWLAGAVVELVEGQAADVAFALRTDVTVEQYTAMASAKTGALMGCACAVGALAGGAGEDRAGRLAGFGRYLGVAFQIVDDLLGIFGDPRITGKPVGADLAARKKTYPVLAALASDTRAGRDLAALYAGGDPLTGDQLAQAARWVSEAGGRSSAGQAAQQELARAFAALDEADPHPEALADLTALAHVLTHRER
ncbi:polyprenyl synthetase family protein [Streptomyces sp. H27-D2]|uniref:polyprenyl synthetase family protein n=1 Tax=Streptomyces sp. H27-D2 TaxID=3046304 RepID=UPI002DBCAB51|nr:polyprenyl synthetase family protein [Streptomyces sp. H27-D2]MEC4020692.1 polyprenyl synthetase family protein [Streptomyces sp. H27-D2]